MRSLICVFIAALPLVATASDQVCAEKTEREKVGFSIGQEELTEENLLQALDILKESSAGISSFPDQSIEVQKSLMLAQLYFINNLIETYIAAGIDPAEILEIGTEVEEELPGRHGAGFGLIVSVDSYCRAIGMQVRTNNQSNKPQPPAAGTH